MKAKSKTLVTIKLSGKELYYLQCICIDWLKENTIIPEGIAPTTDHEKGKEKTAKDFDKLVDKINECGK